MRAVVFTVLLTSVGLVCAIGQTPQQQQEQPQQEKPQQDKPEQEKKPATQQQGPASISPLIPLGTVPPKDVAPGSPDAATMAAGTAGAKPAAPVDTHTFVIGALDIIAVSVFENPGFSVQPQAVRPDGKITMPLVGEVEAWNRTPEQLATEIQRLLVDRFMKEPPHVQVIVVDVRSKNYYLQGEVNKPGKYSLVVPTTIMQALVNAGGFKDFANKKDIKIQRGSTFLKFNYVEVSKGKHLEQNILLQPDDQIYVH